MSRPTALVTGGAGFIGSNFVHYLLQSDAEVHITNLDLLTYAGSLDNLAGLPDTDRYRFLEGNVADRILIETTLRDDDIDTLIHFAAESHVDRSIAGPAPFVDTNVIGTFNLLECARRYWFEDPSAPTLEGQDRPGVRFHHISTDEVFGSLGPDDPPFHESSSYGPRSPYAATKAGADHLVRAYFHTYGLPVTLTNCSNNYGPRQHAEKFIPTVLRSCLEGQRIPVYGDGTNIRDWLYVEDHCRGIDAVLRGAECGVTYNIGGDNELSNITLAETICELLDELKPRAGGSYKSLITFVPDRPGHDWRYAVDSRRIRSELGWSPRGTFESGMRKTVQWYLEVFCGPGGRAQYYRSAGNRP